MDLLSNLKVFVAVIKNNSFHGAAEELNLSTPSISKHLSSLEDHLGARLINRSTRHISITEIGKIYLEKVTNILDEIDEAEAIVKINQNNPSGLLRIASPATFGYRHLAPHLPLFQKRFPQIKIELIAFKDYIDIIKESIDVAIRLTELEDSSLIARKIAPSSRTLVASPNYIKERSKPLNLNDLKKHNLITYNGTSVYNDWHFVENGVSTIIHAKGSISMSHGEHILRAVLNDGGIAMLFRHITGRQIREGRLVTLLENYVKEETPIYAVYPSNKNLSPKIRCFIDFLLEIFKPNPYWMDVKEINEEARLRALI